MTHQESNNFFPDQVDIGTTAAQIPTWMGFTIAKENTPRTWMASPGMAGTDPPIHSREWRWRSGQRISNHRRNQQCLIVELHNITMQKVGNEQPNNFSFHPTHATAMYWWCTQTLRHQSQPPVLPGLRLISSSSGSFQREKYCVRVG